MPKEEKYYEITEKGGVWTARKINRKNPFIVFENGVKSLKQYSFTLIAKRRDGKYDLYLPIYSPEEKKEKCHLVLSDIESYQYHNGTFLLRMGNYCTFIQPSNFSLCSVYLEKKILEERKKNLPQIYCKNAYIKKGFEYLDWDNFVFRADNIDYFVKSIMHNVHSTGPFFEIIQIDGIVEPLPLASRTIKIIDDEGQYIHDIIYNKIDKIYCRSIEPFDESDYTEIYPMKKGRIGYWFKDSNGNILKMIIGGTNGIELYFDFTTNCPAKSIVNIKNYIQNEDVLEIWKITYTSGREELRLKCSGETYSTIFIANTNDFE